MPLSYATSKRRGFTLTETVVAIAIFATVMAGVAGVFIGSLHASDAARAKLEVYEQFRAFTDFVERDISCAYRSEDLDDRPTFVGGNDRLAFIAVSQNFGDKDADFILISYYLLDDPQYDEPEYKRLIRLSIPMPFGAVKAFMESYTRVPAPAGEVAIGGQAAYAAFPSSEDISKLGGGVYAPHVNLLQQVLPQDRLFPQTDEQVEALFAVLHGLYEIEYGWKSPYPADPNRFDNVWLAYNRAAGSINETSEMAPRIDDFELVTLATDLRFRYGRIHPADDIGPVPDRGPGGYRISPRRTDDDGTDTTVFYGLQHGWDAIAQGGPPEVVEVNMTFISRTRALRDEPLRQPFHSLVYIPMAFDGGTM